MKKEDITVIEKLLEKLGDIKVNSANQSDFNVFTALGIETKEVLICRLLGTILQPNGSHQLGILPIKSFFENVLGVKKDDYDNCEVILEEQIKDDRRVDIAIYIDNMVYPIEVKIYAGDQKNQITDYYHYYDKNKLLNNNNLIFYLTPNGHHPSKSSCGELNIDKEIRCLSFTEDVKKWLETLEKSSTSENFSCILKQFEGVIEKMAKNEKNFNEIIDAVNLENDDNVTALTHIFNSQEVLENKFRELYICRLLDKCKLQNDGYKYEIKLYSNEGRVNNIADIYKNDKLLAHIKYETNLYLTVAENCEVKRRSHEWGPEHNWHYIRREKDKKIIFNKPFSNTPPLSFSDEFINFIEILNDLDFC